VTLPEFVPQRREVSRVEKPLIQQFAESGDD
jgi:hypothetical protein